MVAMDSTNDLLISAEGLSTVTAGAAAVCTALAFSSSSSMAPSSVASVTSTPATSVPSSAQSSCNTTALMGGLFPPTSTSTSSLTTFSVLVTAQGAGIAVAMTAYITALSSSLTTYTFALYDQTFTTQVAVTQSSNATGLVTLTLLSPVTSIQPGMNYTLVIQVSQRCSTHSLIGCDLPY
jgi:hypothetical protein